MTGVIDIFLIEDIAEGIHVFSEGFFGGEVGAVYKFLGGDDAPGIIHEHEQEAQFGEGEMAFHFFEVDAELGEFYGDFFKFNGSHKNLF
jgi:hypothetical protein